MVSTQALVGPSSSPQLSGNFYDSKRVSIFGNPLVLHLNRDSPQKASPLVNWEKPKKSLRGLLASPGSVWRQNSGSEGRPKKKKNLPGDAERFLLFLLKTETNV